MQNLYCLHEFGLSDWKIEINPDKTQALIISKLIFTLGNLPEQLILVNQAIPWTDETKYLGVFIDRKLTFKSHNKHIDKTFYANITTLKPLIGFYSKLSLKNKLIIYKQIIRPTITYSCPIWGQASNIHINHIQILQNNVLKIILNTQFLNPSYIIHRDIEIDAIRHSKYFNRHF